MLILGHLGITLGTAVLLNGALAKNCSLTRYGKTDNGIKPGIKAISVQNRLFSRIATWPTLLANRIDIRLLLFAALLPDIIDKPVGLFLLRDTFGSGRVFGHTLLFAILISLVGLFIYRSRGKLWLLVLSFGAFTHLIFDQMWRAPQTLLWPLYGLAFVKVDTTQWMTRWLYPLLTNPGSYVPELVGAMILIWFIGLVIRQGKFFAFIKNGELL